MLRIGQYDAFEKWNILCRYWKDNASVPDLGTDKFDRPRLPRWQSTVARHGERACSDYIRAKADGVGAARFPVSATEQHGSIDAEFYDTLRESGYIELQRRVRHLAEAMAEGGLDVAVDSELPVALANRIKDVFKAGALRGLIWTEENGEVPTIEILREDTSPTFPKEYIRNKRNVLSLFSAQYLGRSDVIHIHDAAPAQLTMVDLEEQCLNEMKLIYSKEWNYICQDYAEFLRNAADQGQSYDLIVSDPFKDLGRPVGWEFLPLIMKLCTDVFITNYFNEMFDELDVGPNDLDGLSKAIYAKTGVPVEVLQTIHRSPEVHWVAMRMRNGAGRS